MTITTKEPMTLTLSELAAEIRISTRTAYRKLSEGSLIPPRKICGQRRWLRDEVRQWIAAGCPTAEEWSKITHES